MGFIKPNNNSGGSGGGLTPQELSRLNNAYSHSKSEHAPTTAEENVQPDWNETDTTSDAYIKNKPDLSQIGSGGNIPSVTQIEPQELDMPKVFFYGNALPTTKDNVNLTMDYISNTAKFSSFVKLKCQGTSSMSYAKKNFTVAMYSDEARKTKLKKDFKGWGAQSKFCLKANYVDTTHTRNISGARIAYDMVASRPDSPFKQQLLQCPRNGAVDGFPIKLYFNGEFYGIYTWNIPKDGWMFNMDEGNVNHMVLCAEKNNDSTNISDDILRCEFRKEWDGTDGNSWSIEFGTYSDTLKNSFNRCVNFVMTATDEQFKTNIGQYFDLYSLLDYYCFSYFTAHIDGLAKNMLMATYDGVIWGATLYDMDSIYGADWQGTQFKATNIQCPEQYQDTNSLLWQRIERCFGAELYTRYLELRQGALSLSNIIKHVEEIYDVIPDRVFADEKAKWTSLPGVNINTMTRFRNYMRDRAVYVDAQMQEIGTNIPCAGIVLSADTLSFTTTDTQTLSVVVSPTNCTDTVTWSVSPTGIVTVKNGVVTPVANGTCTITATCGSQSATCAVTVSGISEGGGDTGGYTDISYIESTGTQYINTRIVPTTSTKIELVAEMSASKQYDHIFGSDNFMKVQWMDDTGTAIYANKKNGQSQVSGLTLGKHTYVMDMTDTANVITIDGATYGTDIGHVESTTRSLLLLSGYKGDGTIETGFCGIGKIYSCKIYYEDTLVANMKPVLTNSGTYGLLDTVNNTFYGSEVGSFTGGGTDTTLLYSLPEETTFNGTSTYIDTGVALLSTDQDFTIVLDVIATEPQNNSESTIFHCMHEESPYPGLSCMTSNGDNGFYIPKGNNVGAIGKLPYLIPPNIRTKVVIIKEGTTLSAYNSNNVTGSSNYTYTQVNENLLIGAYQTTSGVKGRYFSGTVYDFKIYNKAFTSEEKDTYLDININNESSRVFKIDSTCMNTTDNTLTDNIAGISATLTGNPTVSGNQIVFTANDKFNFDISSLNLTNSNRTFRIKFTPTTLDNTPKNVMALGSSATAWNSATTCYINSANLILQHGSNNFANVTMGSENGGNNSNRLPASPVTGQEYELVISENVDGNIRWYIDGTLVQDGTTTLFNPLYLSNTEGVNRFVGSYSLIEIYNGYCNNYTEFTNMVNNASSDGDAEQDNLLNGITWSASADNGIYNNSAEGTLGAEKGAGNGGDYLSGQIPCGKKKYVLSNINGATFLYKEMYVYASDGTFLGGSYNGGKYNTDGGDDTSGGNVTMDLRNIQEEPAYMKITVYPNNIPTNNNPSNQLKLIALHNNVITLDGSLTYGIPNYLENPSGQNGQVLAEYILPGLTKTPSTTSMGERTRVNDMNSGTHRGVGNLYTLTEWEGKVYLVFTLDMAETGVTNDVESITNYLSSNPLTFKYVM